MQTGGRVWAVLSGGCRHQIQGKVEYVTQTIRCLSETPTHNNRRWQISESWIWKSCLPVCTSVVSALNVGAKTQGRVPLCQKEIEILCCVIFFFFTLGLWLSPRLTLRFHSSMSWTPPHYMSPARPRLAKSNASEKSWSGSRWSRVIRRVKISVLSLFTQQGNVHNCQAENTSAY